MFRVRRPGRTGALLWAERLGAVGQITDAAEQIAARGDRRRGGLLDRDLVRDAAPALGRPAGPLLRAAGAPVPAMLVQGARIAAGVVLLARTGPRARLAADAVMTAAAALTRPQLHRAANGADQMAFVVSSAATAARLAGSPRATDAALWFVGLNSAMGYAASGLLKSSSPAWRDGRAVTGVMRTANSGDPDVTALLRARPGVARLLGPAVIALESSFAAAFLRDGRLAPVLVASAAAMHLANARMMGLHQFLWAFGATYPPLLYVSGPRDGVEGRRDDLLPAVTGLVLAGTACAGLLAPVLDTWRGSGHRHDGAPVARSAGRGARRPVGPVVLLARSPLVPPERWQNVVDRLPRDTRVVYGAGAGRTGTLDETADRNADQVVEAVRAARASARAPRDVVLVGHGAGGLVALRVARRLADRDADTVRVTRVVWVDPASAAADGPAAAARDRILRRVARSLRFGMAPLMRAPSWVDDLAPRPRAGAAARMRRRSTWTEAAALWREAADGGVEPPAGRRRDGTAPVVVVVGPGDPATAAGAPAWTGATETDRVPSVDGDTVLTAAAGADAVAAAVLGPAVAGSDRRPEPADVRA